MGYYGTTCNLKKSTATTLPDEELQALSAFFNSAGGDNWHQKSGWVDNGANPCGTNGNYDEGFFGVICTEVDSVMHVKEIWLSTNRVIGYLDERIGTKLKHLTYLDLDNNNLQGILKFCRCGAFYFQIVKPYLPPPPSNSPPLPQ